MQFENKTKPLISIAVAVYNPKEEYFRKCMDSLQAQTYRNIEIILVDDGSREDVALLCDEYAISDSRVKVFHKENGGLPSTRNVGIKMAKGEYLIFVDNDDYAEKNMVQRGYEMIEQSDAQIAVWTFESFSDNGQQDCYYRGAERVIMDRDSIWRFRALMLDSLIFKDLQYALCMTAWGKMYKCSVLREHTDIRFNEELCNGGEDNDFLQRLLPVVDRLVLFHENLYYYRDTVGSMTSKFNPRFVESEYEILKILKEDIRDDKRLAHAFDKYCCNHVLMAGTNYLLHPDNCMGFKDRRRCLKIMLSKPEYKEALKKVKREDFPILKYLFMVCARFRWYGGMLILVSGYLKKLGSR